MTIELPWPPRELSPNARVHWAVKSKAAKKYRSDCARIASHSFFHATGILPSTFFENVDSVVILVEFRPPNNRRRDRDNLISSLKSAQDGIADALGIDDSKFMVTYAPISRVKKGGAVTVTIGGQCA